MATLSPIDRPERWRGILVRHSVVIQIALIAALTLYVFWNGLAEMAGHWAGAEYSHAYFIPVIAAWMAARQSERLADCELRGSWTGVVIFCLGLLLAIIGELATLNSLIQFAFLVCLAGLFIAAIGWRGARHIAPAFFFLTFMVPLPLFFLVQVSAKLQLISTSIGIWLLQGMSIPVLAEGNVIDLGKYQLQVAEACSGLRYLFPLMSFGFLVAYLYRGPLWQRAWLFVSTIPIAIAMNGLRVGMIGLAVDRWGLAAAQGFTHLFEGWVIFLVCLALLSLEAAVLLRLGGPGGKLQDALDVRLPSLRGLVRAWTSPVTPWATPLSLCLPLLLAAVVAMTALPHRTEVAPQRSSLDLFPLQMADWRGRSVSLDPRVVEQLKLTDYLYTDYTDGLSRDPTNLYVAYYASQRAGAAIHSPHNCLPGGGWQTESSRTIVLDVPGPQGHAVRANRVVIGKGADRLLVYYWFQERGRIITTEYGAKWYIFVDAVLKHRTDGALIRLLTPIRETAADADARLQNLARLAEGQLASYVPE
jgi:exosortase D (VPLPA-CTERM-specific)